MLDNIETRNDKLFLFSYPMLLKDVDRRLLDKTLDSVYLAQV